MKISTKLLCVAMLALMMLSACNNKKPSLSELQETIEADTDGIYREPMEGYELIVIQDKATNQSADLFAVTAPDTM